MRKAFTLLEMVIVIVVIGVLASAMLPKIDRNFKQELADNVSSDIKHAQYLATSDYKQDNDNALWQREFWGVGFKACTDGGIYSTVNTDMNRDGLITLNETVIDSLTGKHMYGSTETECEDGGDSTSSNRMFLTNEYTVESVVFRGGCQGFDKIGFDHLGRPHVGFEDSTAPNYASLMKTTCFITFTLQDDSSLRLSIAPETGFLRQL